MQTREEKLATIAKYREYYDSVLKHNKPLGSVCKRRPGSGFISDASPELVKLPADEFTYLSECAPCMTGCHEPFCIEWNNLEIVDGPYKGEMIPHLSNCELTEIHPYQDLIDLLKSNSELTSNSNVIFGTGTKNYTYSGLIKEIEEQTEFGKSYAKAFDKLSKLDEEINENQTKTS